LIQPYAAFDKRVSQQAEKDDSQCEQTYTFAHVSSAFFIFKAIPCYRTATIMRQMIIIFLLAIIIIKIG